MSAGRLGDGSDGPSARLSAQEERAVHLAGCRLFSEGSRVSSLHVILSGVVCLQRLAHGEAVTVGVRGPGSLLGCADAVLGSRHLSTVVALSRTEVERIPLRAFTAWRHSRLSDAAWLHGVQAREIENQMRYTLAWATLSCHERLDQLLAELAALAGVVLSDGSRRVALPVCVETLGRLASMRRETASRHLWHRIRSGSLHKSRGWFVVPRESDLTALIGDAVRRLTDYDRAGTAAAVASMRSALQDPDVSAWIAGRDD